MESASNGTQPNSYYATQPGQPIIIRTRQLTNPAPTHAAARTGDSAANCAETSSQPLGTAVDAESTYPGLEAYEQILGESTTTTALFTAAPAGTQHSTGMASLDKNPPPNGEPGIASLPEEVPVHQPPTRNVGSKDERDIIASSLQSGVSPKELVDSIRRELTSLSGKLSDGGETMNGQRATTNGGSKPVKKPRKSSYLDS